MKHFATIALFAVGTALAQNRPALHARELFYTPLPDTSAAKPPAANPVDPPKPPDPPKPAATAKSETKANPSGPRKDSAQAKAQAKAATTPSAAHMVQAAVPLGLRYAVLKRDDGGKFVETDPDTAFRSGDRIRIQVDANTNGYLYVVMQGSSGTWRLLFPSPEVAGGSNSVRKGQSLQIPPGDRGQFLFDEQAGTEKLFLVLTRQAEPDLDKLIYSMGGAASPVDQNAGRVIIAQVSVQDDLVDRLRHDVQARDLVFEKVDSASAAPPASSKDAPRVENAAYVVNPSTAPEARLVVDVTLRHR